MKVSDVFIGHVSLVPLNYLVLPYLPNNPSFRPYSTHLPFASLNKTTGVPEFVMDRKVVGKDK